MKKIIAIILTVIMLVPFASCGGDNYAIKYNKTEISQNEYIYWLSSYKAVFLTYYLGGNDTDEAWNLVLSETTGATVEDLLEGIALENIKNNVVCLDLFNSMDLKLSKEAETQVDTYINTLITNAGSREALDSDLSEFSIDTNTLKKVYLNEEKIKAVQASLFAEGGLLELTDAEREAYYNSTYARVKHIYINNVKDFARDEEGDLIIDSQTGTYKTKDLTDEQKAAKNKLGDEIFATVTTGGDFDALMKEHSADTTMQLYPNGYYVTATSQFLPAEILEKTFSMKEGDIARIDSEIGIHIFKREPLAENGYADENNIAFFSDFEGTLQSSKLTEYLTELNVNAVANTEVTDAFSLRTCSANTKY